VSEVLKAVLPSIGVLGLFIYIIRAIVFADRRERAAAARLGAAPPAPPVLGERDGRRGSSDGAEGAPSRASEAD
jgi:hypothetical protein